MKTLLALCLVTAACSLPASLTNLLQQHSTSAPPATAAGTEAAASPEPESSSSSSTTTKSTTETVHAYVNGEPVSQGHGRASGARAVAGASVGKACHHNNDCGEESCFVGVHHQGYCTKICDSWTDCPDGWECEHPAGLNAPQKICLQSSF